MARGIARRFAAGKIEVAVASSRGPESLATLVDELGPLVKPVTTAEALRAEVVILAIPFDAVPDAVNGVGWRGRIVVDATNAVDFPAFKPRDLNGRLSTHIVAAAVPGAGVVKAFNTLPAASLAADPSVPGGRRALFVSGDDAPARGVIVALIERLGFAPLHLCAIAQGGPAHQFAGGVAPKKFILLG